MLAEFAGRPFYLITEQGILAFNVTPSSEGFYITLDEGSSGGTRVRSSKDDVPQADGSILHKRFLTGYEVTFTIELWVDAETLATCLTSPSSREMSDTLMKHLMALVHDNGRLLYSPSNAGDRLLDQIQLLEGPAAVVSPEGTRITFTVDSPFPYFLDYAQTETLIEGGGPENLFNTGTAPMYPVMKVYGPTDYFEILNIDTGFEFIYDASLPGAASIGGGDYAELDMFRNTIYLNGSGANLKPGIDIPNSDFFPLQVGDNNIQVVGEGSDPPPDVEVLWQAAWL